MTRFFSAPRNQIEEYAETLYSPISEFCGGQMIHIGHAFPKSIVNILEYEDYDCDADTLFVNAWIGWDGAGSFKQFSNSDIDTNTRNLINGNYVTRISFND